MADRNACWPAIRRRRHRLADCAVATEHPSSVVTGRPAHRGDRGDFQRGRTRAVRRQPDRVDAGGHRYRMARRAGSSWLDARSLVVNSPVQLGAPNQLFRLSYPGGQLSRLTNDPNDYIGISVTSDGRSLVTGGTMRAAISGSAMARRRREPKSSSARRSASRASPGRAIGSSMPGLPADGQRFCGDARRRHVGRGHCSTPSRRSHGRRPHDCVRTRPDDLNLWTADASGRRIAQLVPPSPPSRWWSRLTIGPCSTTRSPGGPCRSGWCRLREARRRS